MHKNKRKILIMLMSLVLLTGMSIPATLAYMSVKTDTVVNTFVPVKTPDHDLDITVGGEKSLEGRGWAEGDAFTFELQLKEGEDWVTVDEAYVVYDAEDADNEDFNKFAFSDEIENHITKEGTYHFKIVELAGQLEHITYDDSQFLFDVTVAADSNGALDVTAVSSVYTESEKIKSPAISKDEASGDYSVAVRFANVYEEPYVPPVPDDPDPIKVTFEVDKKVRNTGDETIGPKGFDFKLVKNSPQQEWTAEADENGYAAFEMTYTKDDIGKVYLYELSEVNDGVEGVTYSDKVYDISVEVLLSDDNELYTNIKVDDKVVNEVELKFENIYAGEEASEPGDPSDPSEPTDPSKPSEPTKPGDTTDPSVPKDDGSKTGDDFNVIPVVAIMLAALAVAVAILGIRRKKA